MSYYSKPLSADVGSIQIFCRMRLTENLRWINKWVLIEIINTNRNKEKVMRFLVPCKHIMVRKCLLLSQRNNKCKNCIKMKNVNVHHYLFLSETYEPVARCKKWPDSCCLKESFTVIKKWTVVVLNLMIVHVNIKSFQYASVVLIKVLIDPSKYLDHPRRFCKK